MWKYLLPCLVIASQHLNAQEPAVPNMDRVCPESLVLTRVISTAPSDATPDDVEAVAWTSLLEVVHVYKGACLPMSRFEMQYQGYGNIGVIRFSFPFQEGEHILTAIGKNAEGEWETSFYERGGLLNNFGFDLPIREHPGRQRQLVSYEDGIEWAESVETLVQELDRSLNSDNEITRRWAQALADRLSVPPEESPRPEIRYAAQQAAAQEAAANEGD